MKKKLIILFAVLVVATVGFLVFGRVGRGRAYALGPIQTSTVISPNGQYIAYGKTTFNDVKQIVTKILVRSIDGGSVNEIGEVIGTLGEMTWLGDDALAVPAYGDHYARGYAVFALGGKCLQSIELPPDYQINSTKISPDGRHIAMSGKVARWGLIPQDGFFKYDLMSGKAETLTSGYNLTYAWSPDSQRVVLAGSKSVVIDVETGQEEINPENNCLPDWSPDGRYIAGIAGVSCGSSDYGQIGIYDTQTGNLRVLPGTDGAWEPKWSRSGEWIAYASRGRDYTQALKTTQDDKQRLKIWDNRPPYKVYVVNASGGEPRELFATQGEQVSLAWGANDTLCAITGRETDERFVSRGVQLRTVDMRSGRMQVLDDWDERKCFPVQIGWSVGNSTDRAQ